MKRKLLSILIAITMMLLSFAMFTGCNADNRFPVQGNTVVQISYRENVSGYETHYFNSYSEFKKSYLAEEKVSLNKRMLKDEAYCKAYFEEKDLLAVVFNSSESNLKFFIKDLIVSDNNYSIVLSKLVYSAAETADTTYCCFIETEKDVKSANVDVTIDDEYAICKANYYMLFPSDIVSPSVTRCTDTEQLDALKSERNTNVIINILYSQYNADFFSDNDLLVVEIFDNINTDYSYEIVGGKIQITAFTTKHYISPDDMDNNFLFLIFVPINKDAVISAYDYTLYIESDGVAAIPDKHLTGSINQ